MEERYSIQKIREFEDVVDAFLEDSTSFLAKANLRRYIDHLPYGSVDHETLNEASEKLMDVDATASFMVFEYSVKQVLHFQKG